MRGDPDVLGVVNTGHRCDSQKISVFRCEYYQSQYRLSNLNVHRWSTTKLMQVNSHGSRSVASNGLTKCIQAMVSLNIYKNSANNFGRKTGFKIENEIDDHDQSIPKLTGILTHVFCTFGQNLVILAWTGDEFSCWQAQNGVTFDFRVKFDLESQGQLPPKTIDIITKVFLHLWSKFGDPSWNGSWVIARTS